MPIKVNYSKYQTEPTVSRKRRKILITGLAAGGALVCGGVFVKIWQNANYTPNIVTLPIFLQFEYFGIEDVKQVLWSYDAHYLAASFQENTDKFVLWNIQDKREIWSNEVQNGNQSFSWSPNETKGILLLKDSIKILQIENGVPIIDQHSIYNIQQKNEPFILDAAVWSPDKALLAFVDGLDVCILDIQNRQIIATYRGHEEEGELPNATISLFWSPDSRYIASVLSREESGGSTLHVWQTANGQRQAIYGISPYRIDWLQWSPNSMYLLYSNENGDLLISDTQRERIIWQRNSGFSALHIPGAPSGGWSPDGKYLVVPATDQNNQAARIQVIDAVTHSILFSWPIDQELCCLTWSLGGKYISAVYTNEIGNQSTICCYDAKNGMLRFSFSFPGLIWSLSWSSMDRYLAVWGRAEKLVMRVYKFPL